MSKRDYISHSGMSFIASAVKHHSFADDIELYLPKSGGWIVSVRIITHMSSQILS